MFRASIVALQKYAAPASTPSRQVFDIVLKSGSISAADLFAKAKELKAPDGESSVRSKTCDAPTFFAEQFLGERSVVAAFPPASPSLLTMCRHAKKILQFLSSKTLIKAHPAPAIQGEKKRRTPFLYRVLSDSKKTKRLISVRLCSVFLLVLLCIPSLHLDALMRSLTSKNRI